MNRRHPLAFTHVTGGAVLQAWLAARFTRCRDGRIPASGPFTLVMERHSDGWKILHDLSSSD